MAESDYSSSHWLAFSTSPGPQGAEMPAPLLPEHAPSFDQRFPSLSYEPPYPPQVDTPHRPAFPQMPAFSSYSHAPETSPYSQPVPLPPYTRPYSQHYSRPPLAPRNSSGGGRMDNATLPETGQVFPRMDDSMSRRVHAFYSAYFTGDESYLPPEVGPSPIPRRYYDPFGGPAPPVPGSGDQENLHQLHQGPPSLTSRPSHMEQLPYNSRAYNHSLRRSAALFGPQGRRSDRSVSPRTSTRRSFDRYYSDLSPSVTSLDAQPPAVRAAPSNRPRHRPREVRPRFLHQRQDPNIPSQRQIQHLKDTLPRRLPSELVQGTSSACDICQKDYANTHVPPSEEEEIAIELPCGHCFGEFCIFQWVCASARAREAG